VVVGQLTHSSRVDLCKDNRDRTEAPNKCRFPDRLSIQAESVGLDVEEELSERQMFGLYNSIQQCAHRENASIFSYALVLIEKYL